MAPYTSAEPDHGPPQSAVRFVYYVGFMIAGDLLAYLIGLIIEREFGSHVSLIVFLALYFLFLWVSWVLAVWITEPKHTEPRIPEPV